jgi:hypothetical protein
MTPNQGAAYIMAQAALLNAKIASMEAANMARYHTGERVAYDEKAFADVEQEFGDILGHNPVLAIFEECHEA